MKLGVLAVAAAMATGVALSGEEYFDEAGKRWWKADDGTSHQMIYMKSCSGGKWSQTFSSFRDQSDTVSLSKDRIFVLERNSTYSGSWYQAIKMYGILVETKSLPALEHNVATETKQFGAYGVRSEVTAACWNWLCCGSYQLDASQTWQGPASSTLSQRPFVMAMDAPRLRDANAQFKTVGDVTWTIAGDMVLLLYTPSNQLQNCDLVVQSPAVLTLARHWRNGGAYGAVLGARKLTLDGGTGIYFGKQTKDASGNTIAFGSETPGEFGKNAPGPGESYNGIGSSPVLSPSVVAATIELKNGATLTATEKTVVSGGVTLQAVEGTMSSVVGPFEFADNGTTIKVDADATLDLTGAKFSGAGRVTLGGSGTVKIGGEGQVDCFVLDSDAALKVVIASGVGVFDGGDALPCGVTFETDCTGSLFLTKTAGFDFGTRLGGTKAVEGVTGSLYVNDTVRENEALNVGAGEELKVYGSGLASSSSVALGAGATVKFYRTATVGADITSTASATITTAGGGITGTLAGTYVASSVSGASGSGDIWIGTEPGDRLVIDGDWTLNDNGGISFYMAKGEVEVHSTVMCKTSLNMRGGHIKVSDGGAWHLDCKWGAYILNSSLMTEPCCLEAGTNGLVQIDSGNTEMRLGGKYEAKLLVSGGTYYHRSDGFLLYANGIVEVTDGVFRTDREITCADKTTTDNAKVILSGGEFQCAGNYQNALFKQPSAGEGACTVLIDGNPTIQLPWKNPFDDVSEGVNPPCHWTCTPGSVLKINAGENNKVYAFNMHNFEANGLVFDLNTRRTKVILADCANNPVEIGWRMPGNASSKVATTVENVVLNPSYVVPAGQTFDAGNPPTGWYEGFVEGTLQSLTFEEGSTFLFPYFGSGAALALGGKLTLPSAANYRVDAQGPKTKVENATILTAADGIDGDCTWTCVGGISRKRSQLVTEGDSLLFSYDPLGALLILR